MLGLVIPAGFDEQLDRDGTAEIEGYAVHWARPGDIDEIRLVFESKLTEAAGVPLHINVSDQPVYPPPEAGGQPFMITLVLLMAITIICAMVVPYLLIEEKETHTLDALLVSPATSGQVIAGKALAGLFFGLIAAAVVLAFNLPMINNWPLIILAVLCGVLFAVALGLLLGGIFDNQQNLNLWMGLVLILLLMPVFLANFGGSNWPPAVSAILPWIPTVALGKLIRASFSDGVPIDQILVNVGIIAAVALMLYGLVAWRVRHFEQ